MFCKACGRNNPDGQTVCSACGSPIGTSAGDASDSAFQVNFGAPQAPATAQTPAPPQTLTAPQTPAPPQTPAAPQAPTAPQTPTAPQAPVSAQAPNAYTPTRSAAPKGIKVNFIAIIGSLIALVSLFLPFWKYDYMLNKSVARLVVDEANASGVFRMFNDGTLGIFAIVGILACIISAATNTSGGIIGGGVLTGAIALKELGSVDDSIGEYVGKMSGALSTEEMAELRNNLAQCYSKQIGCYLVFIGVAIMLIGGIMAKIAEKKG